MKTGYVLKMMDKKHRGFGKYWPRLSYAYVADLDKADIFYTKREALSNMDIGEKVVKVSMTIKELK